VLRFDGTTSTSELASVSQNLRMVLSNTLVPCLYSYSGFRAAVNFSPSPPCVQLRISTTYSIYFGSKCNCSGSEEKVMRTISGGDRSTFERPAFLAVGNFASIFNCIYARVFDIRIFHRETFYYNLASWQ
jgi:hypothetical protein